MTVNQAIATVMLSNLLQPYTGNQISPTVTTNPAGLAVTLTYNGSSSAPTAVGQYSLVATVNDPNYAGSASGALTITAVNPPSGPTDVSSQVSVTGSGLVYSRSTKLYTGTLTIRNTGSVAIAGPVQVVFTSLISGATLTDQTGLATSGAYVGAPYITAAAASLAPGASITFTVQYSYSGTASISYVPKTLSGVF